jgi:hypothetical protein
MDDQILARVDESDSESAELEFKAAFDPASPSEWCELIKDIVAMANSGGGLIVFGIGFYYLYSFLKKSRFVLKELRTNKRSEIQGKHNELRRTVKHLPKKYQKMLEDKENELNIK